MLSVKSLINQWNKKTDKPRLDCHYPYSHFHYRRDKKAYPQCGLFVYKRLSMLASTKQIM